MKLKSFILTRIFAETDLRGEEHITKQYLKDYVKNSFTGHITFLTSNEINEGRRFNGEEVKILLQDLSYLSQKFYGVEPIAIISSDNKETGSAYLDEELLCEVEGCNGKQYVTEWQDGKITICCSKGLKWINENTVFQDAKFGYSALNSMPDPGNTGAINASSPTISNT